MSPASTCRPAPPPQARSGGDQRQLSATGRHPDAIDFESFGLSFTDLLCPGNAIVTKPDYGTFTEAACNGTPVLFQRRADWPEQDCLIDWLQRHAACLEIPADDLQSGELDRSLCALWKQAKCPLPEANGANQAATKIVAELLGISVRRLANTAH